MEHTYNPDTWQAKTGRLKIKVSLGPITRSYQKRKAESVKAHLQDYLYFIPMLLFEIED